MKKTVGFFLSYMGKHRMLLLIVAVLVSVSALANLLGTYMIRPVVNGLTGGNILTLFKGVLLTAAIFFVGVVAAWGYTQTMVKASQRILFDIRRDLFSHIQTLPLKFFDTRGHGDIMSLFTNDIDTISDALNNSFAMVIQSFIQMVGTLAILYVLNWRLSIIVTVCYGIMFWYIRFSGSRSKAYYARQQSSLGELDSYIEEMISGQKVVKVFNHEKASFQEFCEKNEALRQAGTGAQGYAATMVPVVVSISYINCAIVAVLGGFLALQGKTDLGSLASYVVFVRQAALPINQFTQQSNFLLAALAGAERVFQVMSLEPEIDEGKVELVLGEKVEENSPSWFWKKPEGEMVPLKGDVRFDHVDFGYTPDQMFLKNISLYATREEIEKAARIANADSFIRRLPQGYDTMVTSDGAHLSQGQRQLLAIARAAVADPPVLILDEATSSVDTRTEALIEKGMDQLMEGRTVFVIAHRLSTVRNSNAIMVLEQGKIVERGDHEDLLRQKGKYYQLYHGMFELS